MAWGPSFLLETPTRPEVWGELVARNREAVGYEPRQRQTKGASFLDLQTRLILRELHEIPEGPILDAGCGTGLLTGPLTTTGRHVVAVDFSESSLSLLAAKALDNTTVLHASLTRLPLPDESFSAVVCSLVIQHMPGDIRGGALAELVRCLVPGGTLIVVAYNQARFRRRGLAPEGVYTSGIPYYSFTHGDLVQTALEVGLRDARVRPLGLCLLLKAHRGGSYVYRRWHALLNRVEGVLGHRLPVNRPYPSEYWLMHARKPRPEAHHPGRPALARLTGHPRETA